MGKFKKILKCFGRRDIIVITVVVLAAVAAVLTAIGVYDYCRDGNCVPTGGTYATTGKSKSSAELDAAAVKALGKLTVPDYVNIDYINLGRARTGDKLTGIHNIVIHYTGNPGTTAQQNRSYFGQPDTLVCSHFLVGLDGEIIQCIPLDEWSAASNTRNPDTISIEVCHPDESGRFTDESYAATVKLTAWLCSSTGLSADDIIRHHDITGKECPKYFVDDPDAWQAFKNDVAKAME